LDLDSIASVDCPGVYNPATIGFSAQEALDISFEAGRNPQVVAFDISEFNLDIEKE
jgi:arginase family enzyme